MWLERLAFRGRVAAQRDDMAHAGIPVGPGHFRDLRLAGSDAGQMGCSRDIGFLGDSGHGRMGALAGGAAGTISDRNKSRIKRFQRHDTFPKGLFHLFRFRRKKLEGNIRIPAQSGEKRHIKCALCLFQFD